VELQPLGQTAITDSQGQFTISDLAPGKYALTISYVGFTPFSTEVNLGAGGSANVDAVLQIATVSQEVIVRGQRERGEIEALNREETSDNIVQVTTSAPTSAHSKWVSKCVTHKKDRWIPSCSTTSTARRT
jgi:hypothetical protein